VSHHFLHGEISDRILKCAVQVHSAVGPRLPELSYQRAMAVSMTKEGLRFREEPEFEMFYEGVKIGCHRPDFIVEDAVIVELKAVKEMDRSIAKQMLTYLRVTELRVALLINFNAPIISLGVKRFVL
jgi:GxxExxY protein